MEAGYWERTVGAVAGYGAGAVRFLKTGLAVLNLFRGSAPPITWCLLRKPFRQPGSSRSRRPCHCRET